MSKQLAWLTKQEGAGERILVSPILSS
jgi:hypothetical protein